MKIIQSLPPTSELGFCKMFAPWMVLADYHEGTWAPWKIVSVEDFRIAPAAKVLHYAQEIFEGLKIFKQADGQHAFFRPLENVRRMSRSAEILAMAPYPEPAFMDAMKALAQKCKALIPDEPGALYLRPTMIATSSALGVSPASDYSFYILASPVGGYFGAVKSDVPAAISVWATRDYVRAVRGGLGEAKTGANYAASLRAVSEAKKKGFDNVLFLDALKQRNLEELSGMNVFIVERGVLKTPKLGDTVLRGVTRDSILRLAKLEGLPVEESDIDIDYLIEGMKAGIVSEMFACGTGASITAITALGWDNERVPVGAKVSGPVATKLYRALLDIQTGRKAPPSSDWVASC